MYLNRPQPYRHVPFIRNQRRIGRLAPLGARELSHVSHCCARLAKTSNLQNSVCWTFGHRSRLAITACRLLVVSRVIESV